MAEQAMDEPVCVALSGGVDSAVALLRLRERGVAVEALFMKNWEEDDAEGYCAAERDRADAEAVCERLGVRLRTVNFSAEYWERVFERFLDGLRQGLTPNPDVLCNREVKFGEFLDYAFDLGARALATGHYARVEQRDGRYRLLRARDRAKDQSYFLHAIGQRGLARTLFPIGDLSKTEVRRIAREARLPVHDKRDSTGICFIGERPFARFLARYLPAEPGEVVDVEGVRRGRHQGLAFYTVGQRRGLGIGGQRERGGAPWYVAGKDLAANRLLIAQGRDHPALWADTVIARQPSWISGDPPPLPARLSARLRHRQSDQPCTLEAAPGGRLRVRFDAPQWAPAPGQSVVFYRAEECLGGALIERAE